MDESIAEKTVRESVPDANEATWKEIEMIVPIVALVKAY